MMSQSEIEQRHHIEQLNIAFTAPQFCPYCNTEIDLNNPPVKLLVAFTTKELFCSSEHFELHTWGRVRNA